MKQTLMINFVDGSSAEVSSIEIKGLLLNFILVVGTEGSIEADRVSGIVYNLEHGEAA